jgi:hypothetical protein
MFELARHIYGEESDEMRLHKQVLEIQFMKEFVETLKAKGFDLEVDVLNANSTFCSLKLSFPVRRSLHDPGCMGTHVAALKIAIAQVLQAQGVEETDLEVDDKQVCLAKGLYCPTCSFCSDKHSIYNWRRVSEDAHEYKQIFQSLCAALPKLSSNVPIFRGIGREPAYINWLQRIPKDVQAKGSRLKERHEVQPYTLLSDIQIGDVVLSSGMESYSTDMDANLKRYARPAQGSSKGTVFMIENPQMHTRQIDLIDMITFMSPSYRQFECWVEKDSEIMLREIRANTMGAVTDQAGAECCDTYVFSLVININALSFSDIANLRLPGIGIENAKKLHRSLHGVDQKCRNLEDFMDKIRKIPDMSKTCMAELQQQLQERISEGRLSFGCEICQEFFDPTTPTYKPTEAEARPLTPKTYIRPIRSAQQGEVPDDAEFPEDYSVPILFPLLKKQFSDASVSHKWFWSGSGKSIWGGGLLPRGTCPLEAYFFLHTPERSLVYTFKQLLCAQYYDGNCYQCICEDASNSSQQLLLEEAETIDDFMSRLRCRDRLTRQDLADSFEFSASIAKTHTAVRNDLETLVIRDDFLEQCRQVIGLRMPELPCQEAACGFQVRAPARNLHYQ